MAEIMPPIPRYFFLYIEPLLITYGTILSVLNIHTPSSLLPSHISPPHPRNPLEQLLVLESSTYLFLSALMTLAVMLYGGPNDPKLVHATVAALAVVDPPHWLGMLWIMGRGDVLEGWRACVVRGEWTTEMRQLFYVPIFTCAMKVGYLMGWFGKDRVPVEKSGKERKR